jgi:hypothetical protein
LKQHIANFHGETVYRLPFCLENVMRVTTELKSEPSILPAPERANNINVSKHLGAVPDRHGPEDGKQWRGHLGVTHGWRGIVDRIHQKGESGLRGTVSVFNLSIWQPETGFWPGEPYRGKFLAGPWLKLDDDGWKKLKNQMRI